jgi:hypothetical protein
MPLAVAVFILTMAVAREKAAMKKATGGVSGAPKESGELAGLVEVAGSVYIYQCMESASWSE